MFKWAVGRINQWQISGNIANLPCIRPERKINVKAMQTL
jgi:hypothetical protein